MKFASTLFVAAMLAAVPAAAVNVVFNGDFEAGNTGFTSNYTYQGPGQYGNGVTTFPNLALDAGLYAIDTSANRTHFAWVDLADHTSGSGNYLIANGTIGQISTVWEQTVSVIAGRQYNFSAWVADVCCNSNAGNLAGTAPPSFIFEVMDGATTSTLGTFVPSTFGVWQNVGATYNNFGATSLVLRIQNLNTVSGGNDLAVDDISFEETGVPLFVPESPTWVMLIAGFGLVGYASRRRAARVAA